MAQERQRSSLLRRLIKNYVDAAVGRSSKGQYSPQEGAVLEADFRIARRRLFDHLDAMDAATTPPSPAAP
jgi:hypothetical protein